MLAGFAGEDALYFGDDLFVAAHHDGLQLVNVAEGRQNLVTSIYLRFRRRETRKGTRMGSAFVEPE